MLEGSTMLSHAILGKTRTSHPSCLTGSRNPKESSCSRVTRMFGASLSVVMVENAS